MRTERTGLVAGLTSSLIAAATVWVTMISWRGFTEDARPYLSGLAVAVSVVAVVGALLRWRRAPWPVVLLAQLVVGGVVTSVIVSGSPSPSAAIESVRQALDAAQQYASPVPETDAVTVQPLLVIGGVAAALLLDLLACTWRRVPLAGLPLLTLYTVPVSMLAAYPAWWVFALSAAGFLALLYLQEQQLVARWGRSIEGPDVDGAHQQPRRGFVVRASALGVAMVTIGASVVLPQVVPTLNLSVFEIGNGPGDQADIKIVNPMVDLVRDGLDPNRPDIPLVSLTSDDPTPPRYLRISVLNRFSGGEWSSGDRVVPSDQLADGLVPSLQGVDDASGVRSRQYDVQISPRFDSTWLPTQAPIASIEAEGDWRYDTSTMDFIAGDEGLTTAGTEYSMTGIELPDPTTLIRPGAPLTDDSISPELLEVPAVVTDEVKSLAQEVTGNADTPFEKAQTLQAWFRRDGGFTYSVEKAPAGNGISALETFLDADAPDGRTGYCEQFAAAMSAMARTLGIPSRIAVGFLQSSLTDAATGTFTYSSKSLHAWSELYFPGAGWVLFDPTPVTGGPNPPRYTTQDAPAPVVPSTGPSQQPSAQPSDQTTGPDAPQPTGRPVEPEPLPDTSTAAQGPADDGFPWTGVLLWCGLLVLLLGVAWLPRAARRAARGRRLHGGPESAWEELRATVIDLRGTWPEARSPRETAARLTQLFGWPEDPAPDPRPRRGPDQSPEAVAALERIVEALERLRYAPDHPAGPESSAADVELVRAALAAGVTPRTRRRSEWLPYSLLQRRQERSLHSDQDALV